MIELSWGDPERLKRLTLPQLACLTDDRPPNRRRIASGEELLSIMARRQAEEAEWWAR